ncbi:hypothetical protein IMZ31_18860 (plasmid) [Pontibacillus sp. ALD_SL1]|uniref:hypothetical protein n=1 Tax=Pontibacillus sp. ALD_SL1 TaxID=2777185 RepID=UPI001A9699F7|nr:hypothetical protein [Pontibacillus sp. ALD_SL1]QST02610.1 hypothetical protein IMZ31_18860 [Pontibacillus sp. ALD_SL1]
MNKTQIVTNQPIQGDMTELLSGLFVREMTLSPEEKKERNRRKDEHGEIKRRRYAVLQNVCPSCKGRLKRGKKVKAYGYKRLWHCLSCQERFTEDGNPAE